MPQLDATTNDLNAQAGALQLIQFATSTAASILAQLGEEQRAAEPTSLIHLMWTSTPTSMSATAAPSAPLPSAANGLLIPMRLALTITHLLLVSLGTVNLLVIMVILLRPYMRSITNVYIISLCLADFIYLANLTLVAATQLNDKSWPFGSFMCTVYHGTETTGKYASVMFVVLLAGDRYCAMCRANWCARYRNYRTATVISLVAWAIAIVAASPLYAFSEVALLRFRNIEQIHKLCIAKWPSSDTARWYITFSSILIFAVPLALIVFFYYHIINKLREALKSCKRMRRGASSRAPYHRVTRLVLWVVVFHVICWSPFWLFNLFSSIFRLRISTQFDRVVVNIIHLFPYVNCALNPVLYMLNAENFRIAFRSLFCRQGVSARGSHRQQSTMMDGDGVLLNEDSRFIGGVGGGSSVLLNGSGSQLRSSTYVRCPSGLASTFNASSERLLSAVTGTTIVIPSAPVIDGLSNGNGRPFGSPINSVNGSIFLGHTSSRHLNQHSRSNGRMVIPSALSDNDISRTNNFGVQLPKSPSYCPEDTTTTTTPMPDLIPLQKTQGNGTSNPNRLNNRIFCENTSPLSKPVEQMVVNSAEGDVLM